MEMFLSEEILVKVIFGEKHCMVLLVFLEFNLIFPHFSCTDDCSM